MFFKKKHTEHGENTMCAYCESAENVGGGVCVCRWKGVVRAESVCKRFKLDLLKLDPRPIKLPKIEG